MIKAEHLTKYYGDVLAIQDISFEFGENKVYGLLGPNGAGKSTTMNIMTGCLSATEGKVTIDGYDIYEEPEKAKSLIGYLPEFPPLYVNETPDEYLRFVGEAKGLRGQKLKDEIEQVVDRTGISEVRGRLISALSKGYRQRVGIAQALLGDPRVIILDEPTVGLDPLQIIEIRDFIRSLGDTHTVILSSHILSEVQMICEEVMIISSGKVVAFGSPSELESLMAASSQIRLVTDASTEESQKIIEGMEEGLTDTVYTSQPDGSTEISIKIGDADPAETERKLFFAFSKNQKIIIEMSAQKANLEDVFIELTENAAGESASSLEVNESAASESEGSLDANESAASESEGSLDANESENAAGESPESESEETGSAPDAGKEPEAGDEAETGSAPETGEHRAAQAESGEHRAAQAESDEHTAAQPETGEQTEGEGGDRR